MVKHAMNEIPFQLKRGETHSNSVIFSVYSRRFELSESPLFSIVSEILFKLQTMKLAADERSKRNYRKNEIVFVWIFGTYCSCFVGIDYLLSYTCVKLEYCNSSFLNRLIRFGILSPEQFSFRFFVVRVLFSKPKLTNPDDENFTCISTGID